jgi:hypothetical protein
MSIGSSEALKDGRIGVASKSDLDLVHLSDLNLVLVYRGALRSGQFLRLGNGIRKSLVRYGILRVVYKDGDRTNEFTEYGLRLLEEAEAGLDE